MTKLKGYLFAVLASVTYGTNPAFALPLYADGMDASSVLLFRYLLAIPIILSIIIFRKESLYITAKESFAAIFTGIMMAISSLSLFVSYNYMAAGIASTLLFVYPILVALCMTVIYHEKLTFYTIMCLILSISGIWLLYDNGYGITLNAFGVLMVVVSAVSYSVYLIYNNVSNTASRMSPSILILYQLVIGSIVFYIVALFGDGVSLPSHSINWFCLFGLAVFPTALSFITTVIAIRNIGSTPTAILGALEPLTAIILGYLFFNQIITPRESIGLLLIIIATMLVIGHKPIMMILKRGKL